MIVIRSSAAGRSWLRWEQFAADNFGSDWLDTIIDTAFGFNQSYANTQKAKTELKAMIQFVAFIDKHPLVLPELTANHDLSTIHGEAMRKYWEMGKNKEQMLQVNQDVFGRCVFQGFIAITGSTERQWKTISPEDRI